MYYPHTLSVHTLAKIDLWDFALSPLLEVLYQGLFNYHIWSFWGTAFLSYPLHKVWKSDKVTYQLTKAVCFSFDHNCKLILLWVNPKIFKTWLAKIQILLSFFFTVFCAIMSTCICFFIKIFKKKLSNIIWYHVKGLVIMNTHVQYKSPISSGLKVMAKVKVFQK